MNVRVFLLLLSVNVTQKNAIADIAIYTHNCSVSHRMAALILRTVKLFLLWYVLFSFLFFYFTWLISAINMHGIQSRIFAPIPTRNALPHQLLTRLLKSFSLHVFVNVLVVLDTSEIHHSKNCIQKLKHIVHKHVHKCTSHTSHIFSRYHIEIIHDGTRKHFANTC